MLRKGLIILMTVMLADGSGLIAQVAWQPLLASHPRLERVHSPESLSKFMRKNFKFVEDAENFGKVDYWQSPEAMLGRKKGDCEDFALFAHAALTELGIESHVISMYGKNQFAHTVTVFKHEGKYRVINDGKLKKYDTKNLEDALSKVEPNWTWAAYTERRNDRGWMNEIFYNPAFQPHQAQI